MSLRTWLNRWFVGTDGLHERRWAKDTSSESKKGALLQAQADRNLDKVIRSNVKNDQGVGVRRIAYRRTGRVRVY